MSNQISVLDIFNEFQESGGGGAPDAIDAGTYKLRCTDAFVYGEGEASTILGSAVVEEGPLAGKKCAHGGYGTLKGEGHKYAFVLWRQLGIPDDYLKQAATLAGSDKQAFLTSVSEAIKGRIYEATLVVDNYKPEQPRNKIAKRTKVTLLAQPPLPALGGVPQVAAAPVAAAPAVQPVPVAAPEVAPTPGAVPVAVAVPAAAPAPVPVPVAVPAVAAPVAAPVVAAAAPAPAPVAAAPVPVAAAVAPAAAPAAAPAPVAAAPVAAAPAVAVDDEPGF